MPGKRLSPEQKIEAITLREAGYPIASIGSQLQTSVSTLQRLFKSKSISKGSIANEAIDNARKSLLELLSSDETIKLAIAKTISDDIAHSNLIREKAALITESLNPADINQASLAMRALVAHSTIIKNTSDTLRNHSKLNGYSSESAQGLEELIIRDMTEEEVNTIRKEQDELYGMTIN